MKPAYFFLKIKEGHLLPLYYFYGEEEYLKNKAVHLVLERLGEKITPGLNFEVFAGSSTPVTTLLDHARTIPFLGARKIILVKEAENIPAEEQKRLFLYLESPSKKTTLILTSSAVNFRGNAFKPLLKSFAKYAGYGLVLELNHPFQNETPDWIKYMAQNFGKSMGSSVVSLLHELIGNNLLDLFHEMEKLALFTGEKKEISKDDVEKMISRLRTESVFELVDHIGNRRQYEALITLSQLLKSGEQPLKLLALIVRQFRMISRASTLVKQGLKPAEITNALKIREFVWEKLYPQVNKFSEKKLMDCFQQMWEADIALKTGSIPKKLILEKLVMELCE
ncbi:MAG: DNA polymerase III subunit delta [Thermodesulfobacteriota bacterium]|jgi:DNA polymerase-3 subunit delta|nr:MAG: DNA polymerase III subunit delta [Thermodesulfobacteriota bacterium]